MTIRVFPRRTSFTPTDSLAYVSYPPLFRPEDDEVRVSVCFSWDIAEGRVLARAWGDFYPHVILGGPAFDDPGDEFEPGLFLKPGVAITSRGCPKSCSFCLVSKREGSIRELKIQDGWIIQDNNLLACSRGHIEAVFEMLSRQHKGAVFAGGLDATLFQPWHRWLIDSIRIDELWFACDSSGALADLRRVAEMLEDISIEKKRCYVLIGRESLAEAERRLERVYALGFLPFAQLFRPARELSRDAIPYGNKFRALARKWSRPAAYRGKKEQIVRVDRWKRSGEEARDLSGG